MTMTSTQPLREAEKLAHAKHQEWLEAELDAGDASAETEGTVTAAELLDSLDAAIDQHAGKAA